MASRSRRAAGSMKTIDGELVAVERRPTASARRGRTGRRRRRGRACPAATASRASVSASIVGTPSFSNCARTWLLPVAMPPVKATRRISAARRAPTRGAQRVHHQHRDRQRPDAAGHRRQRAGHLGDLGMHVADEHRRPSRGTRRAAGAPRETGAARRPASVTRFMPTSITVAPGFTKSFVTSPGRPTAATRMSAWRQTSARSGVFEWQIVTVASRCSSSSAIGLPTMSLRPMTTACAAGDRDLLAHEQLDDAGRRAGDERRPVLHHQPDVDRREPVDVLLRSDGVEDALRGIGAHRLRQRRLHEDAVVHRRSR